MKSLDPAAVVNTLTGETPTAASPADWFDPNFDAQDFARRVYRNEIFTSDHVRQGDESMMGSIFMPLVFMGSEDRATMAAAHVTLLYAEMRDAGPLRVNGYPSFFSMSTLTMDQHRAFREAYRALLIAVGELKE